MSTWTTLHIRVRNDSSPPHKVVADESKFTSRQEALKHLLLEVLAMDYNNDPTPSHKDFIRNHLLVGGAYWDWEWKRKGSGDYYQVVEDCTSDFILNLDYDLAQDLEALEQQDKKLLALLEN